MENETSSEQFVYISPTGNCYHCTSHCGNMISSNAILVKESEAIIRGKRKCLNCFYRYPNEKRLFYVIVDVDIYVELHFGKNIIPETKLKERENMEFPQLLEDVRARITVNKKNRTQIFEMMNEKNIRKEVRIFFGTNERKTKKGSTFF